MSDSNNRLDVLQRHCRIVTLDEADLKAVELHKKYAAQDSERSPQRKQYAGTQEQRYSLGACAEAAFAKMYGIEWQPRNTPDSGYDFIVNGVRIDVKGCPYQDGALMLSPDLIKTRRCDYFVLVCKFAPMQIKTETYLIRGFIPWAHAAKFAHHADYGRGPTCFCPAWELYPMQMLEDVMCLKVRCLACNKDTNS